MMRLALLALASRVHDWSRGLEFWVRRRVLLLQDRWIEEIAVGNVRVIRRAAVRDAVARFVVEFPPGEPLGVWADRLLEIVESATFASSTKSPRTLMEVFAEEDWLGAGQSDATSLTKD